MACSVCHQQMDKIAVRSGGYHKICFRCAVPRQPGESRHSHFQRVLAHYRAPEPKGKLKLRKKGAGNRWRGLNRGGADEAQIRNAKLV